MAFLCYKVNKLIFHDKNLGKGAAIQSAQDFIDGDYVIIQDADLEYDPRDYSILLDEIIKKNSPLLTLNIEASNQTALYNEINHRIMCAMKIIDCYNTQLEHE